MHQYKKQTVKYKIQYIKTSNIKPSKCNLVYQAIPQKLVKVDKLQTTFKGVEGTKIYRVRRKAIPDIYIYIFTYLLTYLLIKAPVYQHSWTTLYKLLVCLAIAGEERWQTALANLVHSNQHNLTFYLTLKLMVCVGVSPSFSSTKFRPKTGSRQRS